MIAVNFSDIKEVIPVKIPLIVETTLSYMSVKKFETKSLIFVNASDIFVILSEKNVGIVLVKKPTILSFKSVKKPFIEPNTESVSSSQNIIAKKL